MTYSDVCTAYYPSQTVQNHNSSCVSTTQILHTRASEDGPDGLLVTLAGSGERWEAEITRDVGDEIR